MPLSKSMGIVYHRNFPYVLYGKEVPPNFKLQQPLFVKEKTKKRVAANVKRQDNVQKEKNDENYFGIEASAAAYYQRVSEALAKRLQKEGKESAGMRQWDLIYFYVTQETEVNKYSNSEAQAASHVEMVRAIIEALIEKDFIAVVEGVGDERIFMLNPSLIGNENGVQVGPVDKDLPEKVLMPHFK